MNHRVSPRADLSAQDSVSSQRKVQTKARGLAVLNSPELNKGTAFTSEERVALGLIGLLPPEINTLESQTRSAYLQYEKLPDALSRNIYLTALHDRNEVLFYRLLSEHLREMIPIVNDRTVGMAISQYNQECRRPCGLYLSIDHIGGIDEAFANLGADKDGIDLILATDAEQILGVGDWGVGGIEVAIGKLAIYTAAAGLDPARLIPVMLDVGTDRESLLSDPMYVGNRHPRVRGPRYEAFIDSYVKAATAFFPTALLQFEDFSPANCRRILSKYRDTSPIFNDHTQGTGAIVLAAAISAARVCGTPLRNHRVIVFGAGTAGLGASDRIRDAMVRDGLSDDAAIRRFWCVDSEGLLIGSPNSQSEDQSSYYRDPADLKGWKREADGVRIGLAEVMRRVKPTMLIGASASAGAFTEPIIKEMATHTERPIVFVLSSPPAQAEASPGDLLAWTEGRALIAAASPYSPITYKGVTYVVGQLSTSMLYPGLALGAVVARASRISDGMFAAAANAVSSLVTVRQPGSSLLPHIDDLRSVSLTVAVAVAEKAATEGLARVSIGDYTARVQAAMWRPEYCRIEAC